MSKKPKSSSWVPTSSGVSVMASLPDHESREPAGGNPHRGRRAEAGPKWEQRGIQAARIPADTGTFRVLMSVAPGTEDATDRLRQIEAVTDAGLAHLDVEDLLLELLDRVRDVLEVDTAAVLLLDPESKHLVATAARGIEEEVVQGVRIPLGRGFAGRIAAEKQAVILDRVDHTNVLN